MQMETMLIIACVVGVLVIAVFFAVRSNTKRASMIEDFARTRGWSYVRTDTPGLSAKIAAFFPDEEFRLNNIVTVETGKRTVVFFDCRYQSRKRRKDGGFATGCLIESDRFRIVGSRMEIMSRNWAAEAILTNQVDTGTAAFSRDYIVVSTDAASASRALTAALQEVLVAHRRPLFNPVRIGLSASGAVLLTGLNAEAERWLDLVDVARKMEESLPAGAAGQA
jgi:hypothetical protein